MDRGRQSPDHRQEHSRDWNAFARQWVQSEGLADGLLVLIEGPSPNNLKANHARKRGRQDIRAGSEIRIGLDR